MGALSEALFQEGHEAYWQAAVNVGVEHTADSPVPHMAKDISLSVITNLTERKIFDRYGPSLAEGFGISYRLATVETWEDLDVDYARSLMEPALITLRQEHLDTHQPVPADPNDPGSRVYCTTVCLVAQHPAFSELSDYLLSRHAAQRLATVDELFLQLNELGAGVKRRTQQFLAVPI